MIACGPLPFLDGTVGHTCPPPHIFPAPQVIQPVPQIENGEALIIPTKSDIDVFVSQKMSIQIWNLEYIDCTSGTAFLIIDMLLIKSLASAGNLFSKMFI
jgi:DNA-dependent RNA polymerase auxiliary subunit epsilon